MIFIDFFYSLPISWVSKRRKHMPAILEIITEEDIRLYALGKLESSRREAVEKTIAEDDRAARLFEQVRQQIH
jgi:hypothetical protein